MKNNHLYYVLVLTATNLLFRFSYALAGTPISENELFKVEVSNKKACVALIKRNESVCGNAFDKSTEKSCTDLQQHYVQPGENYEVALRQVFVKEFSDIGASSTKRGEIAVVANVAPMDAQTTVRFDSTAWKNARVVYYAPNVGQGHFLSMDNLLVFGPNSYQDQSLLVQFYLLELDGQNKGQQQLISQLAELGKAYVSAPASVVNILSTLAKSLIAQNRDDLEIKYETRLSAPLRNSEGKILDANEQGLALQFGHYVLVQMSRNNNSTFQKQAFFNYKDGRVYSDEQCAKGELKSNSYIVFEVKKNPQATPAGNFEVFDQLMERMTKDVEKKSTDIADTLKKLASEQEIESKYSDAINTLNSIENLRWKKISKATERPLISVTPLSPLLKAKLKANLNLLKKSIEKQQANATPDKDAPFTRKQSQFLLNRLIQIAGDESESWVLEDEDLITNITSFYERGK